MYILHWLSTWASVRSAASSSPVWKVMPAASSQARAACASVSLTRPISATSALWESRSLKTPSGLRSSSSMIALYIPMQPSSKTPMIALSRRS